MGTSKTMPPPSFLTCGNDKINKDIIATDRGWERQYPDGHLELLHAVSGLSASIVAPLIASITFQRKRNLSITGNDKVVMKVHFTEEVFVANGEVLGVDAITNTGAGYIMADQDTPVTFAAPVGGVAATGTLDVALDPAGVIGGIEIGATGSGYSMLDDGVAITIEAPTIAEGGVQATGTLVVVAGDWVKGGDVTAAGTGYTMFDDGEPVVIDASTGIQATATLSITPGTTVAGASITDAGTGYTTADDHGAAVVIEASSGVAATGTLNVVGDVVTGITVTNAGTEYAGTETITIPAPLGGGDTATATLVLTGTVSGIAMTEIGNGYAGTEAITVPAPLGGGDTATMDLVLGGTVTDILITNRGVGYDGTEAITISDPILGGVGVTMEIVLAAEVTGIAMLTLGSGYTNEGVVISAGSGSGPLTDATATLLYANNAQPTITFDEDGVAVQAIYNRALSDENTLVFEYPVTTTGAIDNFVLALSNGATIVDADANAVVQDFPDDFAAPTMTVIA